MELEVEHRPPATRVLAKNKAGASYFLNALESGALVRPHLTQLVFSLNGSFPNRWEIFHIRFLPEIV